MPNINTFTNYFLLHFIAFLKFEHFCSFAKAQCGTFVNGNKAAEAYLNDGDCISLVNELDIPKYEPGIYGDYIYTIRKENKIEILDSSDDENDQEIVENNGNAIDTCNEENDQENVENNGNAIDTASQNQHEIVSDKFIDDYECGESSNICATVTIPRRSLSPVSRVSYNLSKNFQVHKNTLQKYSK